MTCGIYVIRNDLSKKVYVGSSKCIEKRIRTHFNTLKNKKHINIKLQRSFDKHGIENFSYSIIHECDISELYFLEDYYIEKLDSKTLGYNITGAKFGDCLTEHPDRENIIEKIRNAIIKNMSKLTKEQRILKWAKFGTENPNFKGKYNRCICGKIIQKNNLSCSTCRVRTNDKNPFFGKKHNDDTKKLLSEKMIERNKYIKPSNSKKIEIDGKICFKSAADAAKHFNISNGLVTYRIKSTKYNWNYIDA